MSATLQRIAGALVLLLAGVMSLPVAAALLDSRASTENLIVPAQLLVMAALGAGICIAVPALARHDASRGRRALTGVWWGLLAAFVGVLVFWLLISGFRGA